MPAQTSQELSAVSLPAGFTWRNPLGIAAQSGMLILRQSNVVLEHPGIGQMTYARRMADLVQWAETNNLYLQAQSGGYIQYQGRIFPHFVGRWRVYTSQSWAASIGGPDWSRSISGMGRSCQECGDTVPYGEITCPGCGAYLYCMACFSVGAEPSQDDEGLFYCNGCSRHCQQCETRLLDYDGAYCDDCAEHAQCEHCEVRVERLRHDEQASLPPMFPMPGRDVPRRPRRSPRLLPDEDGDELPRPAVEIEIREVNGHSLCLDCSSRLCQACDTVSDYPLTYAVSVAQLVCRQCFRTEMGRAVEEEDETTDVLEIPSIPGRESIRLCGIEIEGANGSTDGNTLAMRMYSAGLSPRNTIQQWHHGEGFARVETDNSVDWELILGPVNVASNTDMQKVRVALGQLRELVHSGQLGLDLRCGLHIHVGAERVGLKSAFNLNTIYSYLEDVIYRLGAARWPVHRSIQQSVRYCQQVQKFDKKLEFGRWHERAGRDGHYYGLSFFNYFQRVFNNCECGAIRFDSWESCECDLGKCTFEFRVFNTTANAKKLHAYLALCQALVAKAISMDEISNPERDFKPMSFVERPFKMLDNPDEVMEQWTERLRWIFSELPLTQSERDALLYCVRYSELKLVGEDLLSDLRTITTEEVAA